MIKVKRRSISVILEMKQRRLGNGSGWRSSWYEMELSTQTRLRALSAHLKFRALLHSLHATLNIKVEGEGEVVPVLCLTEHHSMKAYWYSSTHSLTSALDGGRWSDSRPDRFTPRERAPGTHWIEDWVVKRKIPSPHRESNLITPIIHLVPRSKNAWSYTFTPKYALMTWCSVEKT
jgi:hypothetical protein